MTGKVIVTLQSAPSVSVEVPEYKDKAKQTKIERSCFGALRFYPGIPKTITVDELDFIQKEKKELASKLKSAPYVESKRVDKRGVTEAELNRLSKDHAIEHLSHARKIEVLKAKGAIKASKPVSEPVAKREPLKKPDKK